MRHDKFKLACAQLSGHQTKRTILSWDNVALDVTVTLWGDHEEVCYTVRDLNDPSGDGVEHDTLDEARAYADTIWAPRKKT